MEVRRVGASEEARLRSVAEKVEADLRSAGLPVTQLGDSHAGPNLRFSGAGVFYDPTEGDSSGGVFVSWQPSTDLMELALTADVRAIALGGAALDAMIRAIQEILVAAAWEVDAEAVGVHENCVKVFDVSK